MILTLPATMKFLYLKNNLKSLMNSTVVCHFSSNPKFVNKALGGKSNYEKDFHDTHIPTTYFQKVLLGLGSGFMSITDPRRGDMVAVMGETTGGLALEYIQSKMLQSDEGRKILEEKPRISSSSVDLEKLKKMPEGTLGKAYSNFLERYKYSPDERLNVRFVDDIELAYVATRYREAHDLFHTILDMPTNMLGEVTVKWVEAIQTKLPMCVTGAFFGPLRLAPKFTRTYSTKVVATLDPDVLDDIKNSKIKQKMSPWSMKHKSIEIPDYIKKNIILVLKMNDASYMYKYSEKFKNSIYRRTLCVEGPKKQILMNNFKNKLCMQMAQLPPIENIDKIISKKLMTYYKSVENLKLDIDFNKNTGLMYLISRAPYEYAALIKIFTEIRTMDPQFKPQTLLDFGSGVGTVIWAAKTFWESSIMEYMTVDASSDMNELAYSIIQPNSKMNPLVKNLIQKQYLPHGDINFDIVISAFSFFDVGSHEQRMNYLVTLWNMTSNYLVLVENGTEHGFQIIKESRELLLQMTNSMNYLCHVVAPCPHDFACPLPEKTSCKFLSKYKLLKSQPGDYYDKTPFSYIVFKKERRNKNDKNWPRVIKEVIFRRRQVICNLCTKDGQLQEVIISKGKYNAETYTCARKLKWGDFFPGELNVVHKERKLKEKIEDQQEMIREKNSLNEEDVNTENETVEK